MYHAIYRSSDQGFLRGGGYSSATYQLEASWRPGPFDTNVFATEYLGFRLVLIPEPGTSLLMLIGLIALAGRGHPLTERVDFPTNAALAAEFAQAHNRTAGGSMLRLLSGLLLSLSIASSVLAVEIEWTPVPAEVPENACDAQGQGCFGAIEYDYSIGTYEVTNAEYAEFLNAKAASDPLALYNTQMGVAPGGIARSGASGSFSYAAIDGREDLPVNYVTFYDALRFANWLHNGQGNGSTETGAYTLLGGTPVPSNGLTVTRNAVATVFLTSENEWYKAAYYDEVTGTYFDYPARSNSTTGCTAPTATANRANCLNQVGDVTVGGSYTGSAGPYGTFDQGGNVFEWNEEIISVSNRGYRGGSYLEGTSAMAASTRFFTSANNEINYFGFRVARLPEPDSPLSLASGALTLAALARWRRRGV